MSEENLEEKEEAQQEETEEQANEEETPQEESDKEGAEESEGGEGEEAEPEPEKEEAKEKPLEPTWWEKKGFLDEEAAVKSVEEQRSWATRTSQENARLKRSEEAFRKYYNGELETDDIEQYIKDQEDRISREEQQKQNVDQLWNERVKVALEAGKGKWPDIVTDENIPVLDAFFLNSKKESPLERLEEAVDTFKKIQGSNLKELKKTQDQMKSMADSASEPPAGRQEKAKKDYWNMSEEEFAKDRNKVMGLV